MLPTEIVTPQPLPPEFLELTNTLSGFGIWLATAAVILFSIKLMFKFLLGPGSYRSTPRVRTVRDEELATRPAAKPAKVANLEFVEAEGYREMVTAWISWACPSKLNPVKELTDAELEERLKPVPMNDWTEEQLRNHGRWVWEARDVAYNAGRVGDFDRKLMGIAARITDKRSNSFDSVTGLTNQKWLVNPDPEKRTAYRDAYLKGGARGVDAITRAIQLGREEVREEIRAQAEMEAITEASNAQLRRVADERNARLAALRETHQETAAADEHADWDAQVKALDRPPWELGK